MLHKQHVYIFILLYYYDSERCGIVNIVINIYAAATATLLLILLTLIILYYYLFSITICIKHR